MPLKPRISRTAAYVAAARAIGAREPDPQVRNPDYFAEHLIGDPSRFDLDLPVMHALGESYEDAMRDAEVAGTVCAMIVRARFIDEALERAVAAGATQLLILGAGLDSHAYRFAPLLEPLLVFEVDQPATQEYKRTQIAKIVGEPPENLRFVALNIGGDDLRGTLTRHGFDFSERTFVIMEGLTMYLSEDELSATLTTLAALPAGSSVVFDFVSSIMQQMIAGIDLTVLEGPARAFAERFLHLTRDEPWRFGFPFRGEQSYIEALGLELKEMLDVGCSEAVRRYLTRDDGSCVGDDALAAIRQPQSSADAAQAEAMSYRIAEAFVPFRH